MKLIAYQILDPVKHDTPPDLTHRSPTGVRVSLTTAGGEMVAVVSRRRRAQIATIVERMPDAHRQPVMKALGVWQRRPARFPSGTGRRAGSLIGDC